jgi:hypothetical protein
MRLEIILAFLSLAFVAGAAQTQYAPAAFDDETNGLVDDATHTKPTKRPSTAWKR